jgi:hypothetical protein
MTYIRVILVVGFLTTSALVKAQDNLPAEKAIELTQLHQSIRGTYQIQLDGIRKQFALTLSMIEQIDAARSETEITFLPYGDQIRILILPRQTISAKDFKPIKSVSYKFTNGALY